MDKLDIETWRQHEGSEFRQTARKMLRDANRVEEPHRTWLRNLAREQYQTARRVEAGEADHLREMED